MALPALEAPVQDPTVTTGRAPWASVPAPDPGMQRLAIGILERALNDLAGYLHGDTPGGNVAADPEDAGGAVAFLGDADLLDAYCQLAGTSTWAVQREARSRLVRLLCIALRQEALKRVCPGC